MSTLSLGLARVRARFDAIMQERLAALEAAAAAAADPARRDEALGDAESILHKIAGTAGTLGLAEIGTLARNTEIRICTCRDTGARDWPVAARQILDFIAVARR